VIETKLVRGALSSYHPGEGDSLRINRDQSAEWKAVEFDEKGALDRQALRRGGYVYVPIESESERIMVLSAAGHGALYFNGEPHTANIYGYDYYHVPVRLSAGRNQLLMRSGRGSIRAKLYAPPAEVFLADGDQTLPDMIADTAIDSWGAVIVVNASEGTAQGLSIATDGELLNRTITPLPAIPALSIRKVGFRIQGDAKKTDEQTTSGTIELLNNEKTVHQTPLQLRIRQPHDAHKRTFVSQLDNSVQYFGLRPAVLLSPDDPPASLVLSCHGASVEGIGQASSYSQKSWLHLVAPTNRRPYGFDWEDVGRADAMEVLELAKRQLKHDPERIYLTGHSMGGHGAWHLGSLYPDKFAAIGPSAGWVSYTSYARRGSGDEDPPSPMDKLLQRGRKIGDPRELAVNLKHHGIYVLHGADDNNVPASQARTMAEVLESIHNDWNIHEEPGKGHWWSNDLDDGGATCMDWPHMYDMFARHALPQARSVRTIEFATANPGVSSNCYWLSIEGQLQHHDVSSVKIHTWPNKRRFAGTTENVAILKFDLSHLMAPGSIAVELDGQVLEDISYPDGRELWLANRDEEWVVIDAIPRTQKGSHRYGAIKNELRNRLLFVYGTNGDEQENKLAMDKARLDAETLWYRGNGGVDIVPDVAFDPASCPDRNVVLYGNAETNSAWPRVLKDSPVQVWRNRIQVGERTIEGEELATLFLRPRPDSDTASVIAISGTGPSGIRLSYKQSLFVPFVRYPDCIVLSGAELDNGTATVEVAGYFGLDWSVDDGEFEWHAGERRL
jgi:poly(3-hydroxybutyrate) depolymerase